MIKQFIEFVNKSYSPYHVVDNIEKRLINQGYKRLEENKIWEIADKKYYVKRNDSSIIAFKIGDDLVNYGFNIIASHTDSPCFKLKPNYAIATEQGTRLNVEPYGGALNYSFLDRPLSMAGRIVLKENNKIVSKIVNLDEDYLVIPSLPIHYNREANTNLVLNPQEDLLPFVQGEVNLEELFSLKNILAHDLFLYNREHGKIINKELFISPKIDDLEGVFTSFEAFLQGSNKQAINVFVAFDNEEVGSMTKQGAGSKFLFDSLERVNNALGLSYEKFLCALSNSIMISADNAHAVNPNHPEKYDSINRVYLNKGIVIKYNANNAYTTDGISSAIFKMYCQKANVNYQEFTNRSDVKGGSTLGAISSSNLSILSVDVGAPQLAMHSSMEMAGVKDFNDLIEVFKIVYNSYLCKENNDYLMGE